MRLQSLLKSHFCDTHDLFSWLVFLGNPNMNIWNDFTYKMGKSGLINVDLVTKKVELFEKFD